MCKINKRPEERFGFFGLFLGMKWVGLIVGMKKGGIFMRRGAGFCVVVLVISLLLSLLCVPAYAGWVPTAVIDGLDADRVHLRAEPSQSSASLGLFFTGTEVTLLDSGDEAWAQVEIGSQRGYMMKKYLCEGADPQLATNRQPQGVPLAGEVPLWYRLPATGQPDGSINQEAVLSILGETADGYFYVCAAGLPFYVPAEAVGTTDGMISPVGKASHLLGQVVDNQVPYKDAMSGREMLLCQYSPDIDELAYGIGRFALADLDRDGILEVAVEVQVEGYPFCYLLLDERDGRVYGYEITARGFLQLKADGTATWANGAGNYGFGWRADWTGDPAAGTIALCETLGDQQLFVVDGELTTQEAYQKMERQQHIKPDALWYWPVWENLSLLFE